MTHRDHERCRVGDLSLGSHGELVHSSDRRLLMLGRLAGWVAHEINNPLAGMRNAAELLRRLGHQEADRERYASIIDREVENVAGVVRHLSDALESRGSQCNANLADVVHDAAHALILPDGPFYIRVSIPDDARDVAVPEAILRLVVYSLVWSAMSASHPGGTVHVASLRDGPAVVLSVHTGGAALTSRAGRGAFPRAGPGAQGRTSRPAVPCFDLPFVRDILPLFEGSLTVGSAAAGGQRLITRWPASPRTSEEPRHDG